MVIILAIPLFQTNTYVTEFYSQEAGLYYLNQFIYYIYREIDYIFFYINIAGM